MQLHAIDKEKPMKKLVGRERKAMKKKGEKHHLISLQWFWNTLITGKMTGTTAGRKPSFLAFFRSGSSKDEGIQLRAIFLFPFFTIFTLCATFFMGMQGWSARGLRGGSKHEEEEAAAAAKEQQAGKQ
jgi:hypothetical protein